MALTPSDAQTVLRDQLKVALRDIKQLFDDNLVDETEYKDLKANELAKYKEKLAALVPGEQPRTPHMASPYAISFNKREIHTPTATPTPTRGQLPPRSAQLHSATKSEPRRIPSLHPGESTPRRSVVPRSASTSCHTTPTANHGETPIHLDLNTALRLATPPIFRRRAVRRRRITVPMSEVAALSRFLAPPSVPKSS